ncbi:hypothetical protein NDU88_002633 [Pleurodeles waltl]|uniref:Uncharacterized protein n=1 Tax=Pleurodeles waltl TaxID=8319 RepID=A0AAV7SDT5_PLEWA|nr:hypothetical protein NDU88_002633 [Pleurodeles waltl]
MNDCRRTDHGKRNFDMECRTCCHRNLPAALKHTLDAPEKRYRDCGDRRGGQSLRRAAWPREDPDYVAPAPRTEVELKQGQNPRAG